MRKVLSLLIMGLVVSGCAETKVRKRAVKESASLRYVQKKVEADRNEMKVWVDGLNLKLDEIKALLTPKE